MRGMTSGAFAVDGRLMNVCRLERTLLVFVTAEAKCRLLLDQDQRADDAVALVACLAVFRVAEGSVNDLAGEFFLNGLVALDALF